MHEQGIPLVHALRKNPKILPKNLVSIFDLSTVLATKGTRFSFYILLFIFSEFLIFVFPFFFSGCPFFFFSLHFRFIPFSYFCILDQSFCAKEGKNLLHFAKEVITKHPGEETLVIVACVVVHELCQKTGV